MKVRAAAETVSERIPPTVATLEALDSSTCLLHTGAFTLDGLSMYLAMLGAEFEVVEPPELAARMRDLAGRLLRAVGGSVADITDCHK